MIRSSMTLPGKVCIHWPGNRSHSHTRDGAWKPDGVWMSKAAGPA